MNTQYRKNLKDVATACKNYIDSQIAKAKDDLRWELGTYDLSVESDNTSALIKTMPSGTIMLNVNKIYGDSEVSENLCSNSVNANSNWDYFMTFYAKPNTTYFAKVFNINTDTADNTISLCPTDSQTTIETYYSSSYSHYLGSGFTFTTGNITAGLYRLRFVKNNAVETTGNTMIGLGSTIPTTFKPYFDGIHNLELSGLKVEGANLWDVGRLNITKGSTVIGTIGTLEAGTYTISWASIGNISVFLNIKVGTTVIKNVNMNTTVTTGKIDGNSFNFTLNETSVVSYAVDNYYSTTTTTYAENVMLNRGSTALDYTPYITPTTKTIDLSTILYNGSPLFEENSLKAVGTAKDYITPYLAHKQMGYVDLGSLNWNYQSSTTRFYSNAIVSLIKKPSSNGAKANILCSVYITDSSDNVAFVQTNMTIAIGIDGYIYIQNHNFTDATAFKTAMSGVYLVYELATPIEVSIDWSSTLRGIQGYSNGSITAQNTYDMATTSEIDYLIEEVKA